MRISTRIIYVQGLRKKRYKISHLREGGKLDTLASMKVAEKMLVFETFAGILASAVSQ